MKLQTIIFPTDFSHFDQWAINLATSMARDTGARLVIVHVEEAPAVYGGGELYYGVPDPSLDDLKAMLSRVVPRDPQVPYEHRLLEGEPATAITRLAEELSADLIVMATHGRTGLSRLVMGSVAEAIVRRASCPVLTVKEPAKETANSE
ncbi:MAG: universal stress protein [Pirellulaceae bacterium]